MVVSAQTEFIISLFVLLATALLAGEAALRLGQVALVGELLAGVVLANTFVGHWLGLVPVSPYLSAVQFLATFFILFLAGLEMRPEDIYRMGVGPLLTGIAVFFVPFLLCVGVADLVFPGTPFLTVLFIGVTLSITALPVMGIMVQEFGLTGRPLGKLAMNVALVNELAALTVFAVLLQVYDSGGHLTPVSLAIGATSVGVFLGVILLVSVCLSQLRERRLWKVFTDKARATLRSREAGFAILMVLAMGAALFSQELGLTFVIGAFYAGILVTPESVGAEAHRNLRYMFSTISWVFFIPLFFAITGLQVDLGIFLVLTTLGALVSLTAVAAVSKIGVGTTAGLAQGLRTPDASALGFMVNSRGAVEIAMAVILLSDGILATPQFTFVVAIGLVTTVLAPIGALRCWLLTPASREELYRRVPNLRARRTPLPVRRLSAASTGGPPTPVGPGLSITYSPPNAPSQAPRVIPLNPYGDATDTFASGPGGAVAPGPPPLPRPRRPPPQ